MSTLETILKLLRMLAKGVAQSEPRAKGGTAVRFLYLDGCDCWDCAVGGNKAFLATFFDENTSVERAREMLGLPPEEPKP